MPAIANTIPNARPITRALLVRISVLGNPVVNIIGMACRYISQSKNDSPNWASGDFGGGPAIARCCVRDRGKVRQFGEGAAFEPGFQPGGSVRGTHWVYRCAQVPSAITASSPELSASISGLLPWATA